MVGAIDVSLTRASGIQVFSLLPHVSSRIGVGEAGTRLNCSVAVDSSLLLSALYFDLESIKIAVKVDPERADFDVKFVKLHPEQVNDIFLADKQTRDPHIFLADKQNCGPLDDNFQRLAKQHDE